jgi:hypothetical protein
MFPRILERFTQKEERVDPTTGNEPGDQDEAADSGTISVPLVSAAADQLPQEPGGSEAPKKERLHTESMYPEDWGSKFECMGELVVEPTADPSDVVRVYKALCENLKAEIFYVNPSHRGTSIVCGITDAALFLASLSRMPSVTSWAMTHR